MQTLKESFLDFGFVISWFAVLGAAAFVAVHFNAIAAFLN